MPVGVIPVVPGKKAVDLVLTVDTMEGLYSGHADNVSIASGGSDFTRLNNEDSRKSSKLACTRVIVGDLWCPEDS